MDLIFTDSDEDMEEQNFEVMRRARNFRPRVNMGFVSLFEFNEKFRMSSVKLETLLLEIGHHLEHPTLRNKALSTKEQMLVSLHWLGNGGQYHCVGDMHGISKATVHRCLKRFVNAVNITLFPNVVKWPDNVEDLVQQFHVISGMPQVCGCVDGTLIPMDAPNVYEEHYVDRNGNHSINCMVVCGPTHQFYYVSANWPGSVHDSRVLRNSTLCHRFDIGWRPCPNTVLLGDSGYPLKEWLIVPARNQLPTPAVNSFNRAHKRTRRIVENSLGILKEKYPCLNYLRVQPTFVANIFKCCVALCNFSRDLHADVCLPEAENEEGNIEGPAFEEDDPILPAALAKQQQLINYFR